MTVNLDIANRALQAMGSRTNMTLSEFNAQSSNEAIQSQLIMFKLRDELNRMAPWDCTSRYANLTYITSLPTTPENSSAGPPLWQPGMPAPPWAYEYQYPVDCMRARWIMPQYTALAGGTPIYPTNTATGVAATGWTGPALKFKVTTDFFFAVTAATLSNPGTGYAAGDFISLAQPSYTFVQNYPPLTNQLSPATFTMPVGAPVIIQVLTVGGGGAILTFALQPQVYNDPTDPSSSFVAGSYFAPVTSAQGQGFTTGNGSGATFSLTFASSATPQRVVLCNQENAILCYNAQIVDPNLMDMLFQDAWINILGARLCYQLSGNVAKSNEMIATANQYIMEARKADGNEGLTMNDVTPDWLRVRGNYGGPNWEYSQNMEFDWGSFYSPY